MMRFGGPRAAVALQSAVAAAFFTWPLLPRFWTEAVGAPGTDTPKHLWTLWWMRRELWQGPWGLATTSVNYPDGMELFPISPLDGIVGGLLPLLGVIPLSNALALFHVWALGVCAAWLGSEVVGTRVGAHAAGLLAQGSAFTGFAMEVGVGELRLCWWTPLGLALLVRAHRSGHPREFALLAGALAGATLTSFYHGLFLALATSIWAVATLRRDPRLWAGYAAAALASVCVVLPVVWGFASSYAATGGLVLLPDAAVSLEELVTPAVTGAGYGGGRYLGVSTLVLAAMGVAAGRRQTLPWILVFVVCTLLALGPVLRWNGAPIVLGGHGFVLPMDRLNAALAQVAEPVNFPARFLAPAMIALSVLGAFATRWRAGAVLVPVAIAEVLACDSVEWPRVTTRMYDMAAFEGQGRGAVADLSMVMQNAEPAARNRSISAQIALDEPFATVPVERLTSWSTSAGARIQELPLYSTIAAFERGEGGTAPDVTPDIAWLRDQGYAHLLLTHRNDNPDLHSNALLTELCGEPIRTRNATLWSLP